MSMVFSAATYLALAGAAWIFLRLFQACFWLPRHLKRQNNLQDMLQEKVSSYEKYILECEEKERAAAEAAEAGKNDLIALDDKGSLEECERKPIPIDEKKWKERRECLEMLKKELKRVSDGGDPYDWKHLLEEEDEEEEEKKKEEEKSDGESEKNDDAPEKALEEKKEQ
ncbi:uncharacterized protein LOC141524454 isoform X2 [Cotesia typhae]